MRSLALVGLLCFSFNAIAATNYKWKLEEVGPVGTGSRSVEVKVTPDGKVHMAYAGCGESNCNPQTALWYAVKDTAGSWTRTMIDDSSEDVGRHASLEFEPNGTMHIMHGGVTDVLLRWAYLRPGKTEWEKETISPRYGGYWVSSAQYKDNVYVAHTRFNRTQLRENFLELGTYRNGKWNFEVLEAGGWATNIAVRPNGELVIASHDGPFFRGDVHLTYQENGMWKRQAIDGLSTKLSIAVDSKNFIHAVYGKADGGQKDDVLYATNAPDGKWRREILDGNDDDKDDVFFPYVAVDRNDTIHVSYRDYGKNVLSYARKQVGGAWTYSLIEDMGRPLYSKVIVGPDGKLHIAIENSNRIYYGVCENCTNVEPLGTKAIQTASKGRPRF